MAEGFTCEVDEAYRSACEGLYFYGEHEGKRYCVLHFPGEEKREDFRKVLENKLARKDYDFRGAFFPKGTSNFERYEFDANVEFAGAAFSGERTFFTSAQFNGERTDFSRAQFNSSEVTDFSYAQFNSAEETSFSRAQFNSAEETDFSKAQFSGQWTFFTSAQFSGERTVFTSAQFSGQGTDFSDAQFNSSKGTYFTGTEFNSSERTYFSRAQFSSEWTYFSYAQFNSSKGTDFSEAQFNSAEGTDFSDAQFNSAEGTDFLRVKFGSASTLFSQTSFAKEVAFREATFGERVAFWGIKENPLFASEAWASFDSVRIEKPELLAFNNVLLHPGWFINADVRKVDFTDVTWEGISDEPENVKRAVENFKGRVRGATESLRQRELRQAWRKLTANALANEIKALEARNVNSPYTLLAQACRRLSANAEDNREYPLANEFHYWSMDAQRKEGWSRLGLIGHLYWALNGYGVRAARAFLVLMGMWAIFTTFYVLVDPSEFKHFGQGIGYLCQATVYSLLAMARLNPEPRPDEPGLFQFLVGLEGILGPLQIALLALAVRRKVMR